MLRKLASCVLLAGALAATSGCKADYDHATIDNVKSPLNGNVDFARIVVPVGTIVTAHIVAYDEDHDTMAIDLHTKDSSTVDVANVVTEHDYAFFGVKPGQTEVEMRADGHLVLILTATVIDQPAPP